MDDDLITRVHSPPTLQKRWNAIEKRKQEQGVAEERQWCQREFDEAFDAWSSAIGTDVHDLKIVGFDPDYEAPQGWYETGSYRGDLLLLGTDLRREEDARQSSPDSSPRFQLANSNPVNG